MATRQYIGARYVPKFYTNSVDGSTSWESNVVYEPLTYVTLTNGHMYISKKQVPATVGTPASNVEYWLDIGSYNGFIDQLQSEIDTINETTIPAVQADYNGKIGTLSNLKTPVKTNLVNAINSMYGRKVVCVTDSYGTYPSTTQNWMTKVRDYLGLTDNVDFFSRAYGGAGFATGGETFQQQLAALAANMSAQTKLDITDIVICGGFNDAQNSNQDTVLNAAVTCMTYIKNTFPNAKAHVGFVGWSFNSEWMTKMRQYNGLLTYQRLCQKGYRYIVDSECCLRGKGLFTQEPQGDTTLYLGYFYGHPNNGGAAEIATCVANHLLGGAGLIEHSPDYYLVQPTLASGISVISGSAYFYMQQQGNVISVIKDESLNATVFGFSANKDLSTGLTIEIGTMKDGLIAGIDSAQASSRPLTQMPFFGSAWQTNTGWVPINGQLLFMNNKLYARVYAPSVTSAESIAIHCASGTFPTIAC